MESNNQLVKLDSNKLIEIIQKIPNLSEEDRRELSLRMVSDDIEVRKLAYEKVIQSEIAQHDLVAIMSELAALNKQGVYIKSKQTIKTGSGTFEIEVKGGDTKLIVSVLTILAIVIIAVLIIMFWK
jgi:hypothetical protein